MNLIRRRVQKRCLQDDSMIRLETTVKTGDMVTSNYVQRTTLNTLLNEEQNKRNQTKKKTNGKQNQSNQTKPVECKGIGRINHRLLTL